MSNAYKDWLWDKFSNVLLEANVIDKVLQTIMIDDRDWYGVVHGTKDGFHVKYNIWFDDEEGWNYELAED